VPHLCLLLTLIGPYLHTVLFYDSVPFLKLCRLYYNLPT